MAKKHFARRFTAVSCLTFLSIFLASFSCQDHEVPQQPEQPELAKINTVSAVYGGATNIFSYTVQFEDLGNVPIIEYGIVSYAGETDENHVPDVPAAPYVFPFYERQYAFAMPATLNAATIARTYDQKSNTPTRLFYRAYAIHSNNAVVYGEVKFVDFIKNQNNIVKPVIKTLDASKGDDSDFIAYALQFESLGNVSVTEYGIVIYQGKPNEQQTPEVPTNNPLEKKYVNSEAASLDVKNIIKQYDGPTDGPIRLFYRAYAVLNNGEVVYGEVKFLDFEIFVPALINTEQFSKDQANGGINFQLKFLTLGSNPIVEYGIVYKLFDGFNNSYSPTIDDMKAIFTGSPSLNLTSQFFSVNNSFTTIRYRAYVIHANGKIIYGQLESATSI